MKDPENDEWASPRPDDVSIEAIAHSLALQCRFTGHCFVPYSVAEHSVRVAREMVRLDPYLPSQLILAGLLHHAAEAYIGNVPRPLKRWLVEYNLRRNEVQLAIDQRFNISAHDRQSPTIKLANGIVLSTERRDLLPVPSQPRGDISAPLGERIQPWSWRHAEYEFLNLAKQLIGAVR